MTMTRSPVSRVIARLMRLVTVGSLLDKSIADPRTASITIEEGSFLRRVVTWTSSDLPLPTHTGSQMRVELSARHDASRLFGKDGEQVELLGRQGQFDTIAGRRSGIAIDGDVPELDRFAGSWSAADVRTNTGRQFAQRERLHHVVISAEFKTLYPVGLLPARRHDDDRDFRPLPDLPDIHVQTIAVWQPEIEKDDVGGIARLRCLRPRCCPLHVETMSTQPPIMGWAMDGSSSIRATRMPRWCHVARLAHRI